MFAIALFCASVSGGVANGAAANDANFSSTALFIALLTFAGITVVDGSTTGCFFLLTKDIILFFAAENAFPARSPTALIPLSRIHQWLSLIIV